MTFREAVERVAKLAPKDAIFQDGAYDWDIYCLLDAIDDELDDGEYDFDEALDIFSFDDEGYVDKKVLWMKSRNEG